MSTNLSLLTFDTSNIIKHIYLNTRVDRVAYYENGYNTLFVDFIKGPIKYESLYSIDEQDESYKESLRILADIVFLNFNKIKSKPENTLNIPIVEDVIAKITPDLLYEIINKNNVTELIDIGTINVSTGTMPPFVTINTNSHTLLQTKNMLFNIFEYLEKQSLDYYGENIDYTF